MAETQGVRPGTMIVVVGPSGAGKDSVIAYVLQRLGPLHQVHLVRRVITRPHDAGGEDHDSVSMAEFDARRLAGDFAVSWEAHGLRYGIPKEAIDRIAEGQTLIANGSRAEIGSFQHAFPNLTVVQITASDAVLAARLLGRGRENPADIRNRLSRTAPDFDGSGVIVFDNSGALEIAGEQFADLVAALAQGLKPDA